MFTILGNHQLQLSHALVVTRVKLPLLGSDEGQTARMLGKQLADQLSGPVGVVVALCPFEGKRCTVPLGVRGEEAIALCLHIQCLS